MIFETVRKIRLKYNIDNEIDDEKIADMLLRLMVFDTRENVLDELRDYLQSIIPEADVAFDNLDHEWLSYTTLGRADLIKFELWLNKHQKVNELNG